MNFGIEAIELYCPNTYVDQQELESHNQVSQGKYTKGLGQLQLSFTCPFEDVNSLALTVVNNLMLKNNISPSQVGRLQVGTETVTDKSKSTKTVLMSLFKGHHDIQGATSINACYGATNALINTLNWISSPSWDGRYGIVVAADVASYEDGPARPTAGAGAVAMLISNKPKISFSPTRATYIDHQYDFYKPIPGSEYPIVDGKLSIECYLKAVRECYSKLKEKTKRGDLIEKTDFFCFHSPYYKMVQKAFSHLLKIDNPHFSEDEIAEQFKKKVEPTLFVSQRVGNIYTGSLYACLYSLLYKNREIKDKDVVLFSYGSGLCSSMLNVRIHCNPLRKEQFQQTDNYFRNRVKIDPKEYTAIMLEKEQNYNNWRGKLVVKDSLLSDNVFYLAQIDQKWRRFYAKKASSLKLVKNQICGNDRIKNLIDKQIPTQDFKQFYKLSIQNRRAALESMGHKINQQDLESGGITPEAGDKMIQNVIGKLSLPLGVVPMLTINNKKYTVPMCIEQPSVIAATSSIGKFMAPHSFNTSSSPSIMMGQVHLPSVLPAQINAIQRIKQSIIDKLNESCASMIKRKGGVKTIRVRNLDNNNFGVNDYSLDIMIDVKEAMGANIINTVTERAKQILISMGINTGISILSNYCVERTATSSFVIPVEHMNWKGHKGLKVAQKIVQAYQFAIKDQYRAVTHNKGIMNGVDAVCLATGQDWRALQSAAHAYAARNGKYQPLTHYRVFDNNGVQYFQGKIELPVAVGTVGGAILRNPLYKASLQMLGSPGAQQLAEVMVSVGLAQNFAALRALAIEGIQKGHMSLHGRAIAAMHGVPPHLTEQCCQFMTKLQKYDKQTVETFLQYSNKPRL